MDKIIQLQYLSSKEKKKDRKRWLPKSNNWWLILWVTFYAFCPLIDLGNFIFLFYLVSPLFTSGFLFACLNHLHITIVYVFIFNILCTSPRLSVLFFTFSFAVLQSSFTCRRCSVEGACVLLLLCFLVVLGNTFSLIVPVNLASSCSLFPCVTVIF